MPWDDMRDIQVVDAVSFRLSLSLFSTSCQTLTTQIVMRNKFEDTKGYGYSVQGIRKYKITGDSRSKAQTKEFVVVFHSSQEAPSGGMSIKSA
jgi:hypothetical protein